jgi:hypothetical protein
MATDPIESALTRYVGRASAMGGQQTDGRQVLNSELRSIVNHHRTVMYLACGLAVVLFFVLMYFAFRFQDDWKIVAACISLMGVGAVGVIAFLTKAADQMARGGILVLLSGQLSSEKMHAVAMTLAENKASPAKKA